MSFSEAVKYCESLGEGVHVFEPRDKATFSKITTTVGTDKKVWANIQRKADNKYKIDSTEQ